MSASTLSKGKRGSIVQASTVSNGTSVPSSQKNLQNPAAAAAVEPTDADTPRTPWHEMALGDLHRYRHAHRLHTPSSQRNPQSHPIFANAARAGVYSPSIVAARQKRRQSKKARKEAAAGLKERSSSRLRGLADGADRAAADVHENGKQTREQLAVAVRKHFNAMSVGEGEVVARFIYVVRHAALSPGRDQDKGFRLRFKP